MEIPGRTNILTLSEVYYCPTFSKNIISLQRVYKNGAKLNGNLLVAPNGSAIASFDSRFILHDITDLEALEAAQEDDDIDYAKWHSRLGHISKEVIRITAKAVRGIVSDVPKT